MKGIAKGGGKSREAFLASLPDDDFLDEEVELRELIIKLLRGSKSGSSVRLDEVLRLQSVSRIMSRFIPNGISLGDWIDERIGGEVQTTEDGHAIQLVDEELLANQGASVESSQSWGRPPDESWGHQNFQAGNRPNDDSKGSGKSWGHPPEWNRAPDDLKGSGKSKGRPPEDMQYSPPDDPKGKGKGKPDEAIRRPPDDPKGKGKGKPDEAIRRPPDDPKGKGKGKPDEAIRRPPDDLKGKGKGKPDEARPKAAPDPIKGKGHPDEYKGKGKGPSGMKGPPGMPSDETNWLARLPQDKYTKGEEDIRDAIFEFLASWRVPDMSPARWSGVCEDRKVMDIAVRVFPKEVRLRTWLEKRLGREVWLDPDGHGDHFVHLAGWALDNVRERAAAYDRRCADAARSTATKRDLPRPERRKEKKQKKDRENEGDSGPLSKDLVLELIRYIEEQYPEDVECSILGGKFHVKKKQLEEAGFVITQMNTENGRTDKFKCMPPPGMEGARGKSEYQVPEVLGKSQREQDRKKERPRQRNSFFEALPSDKLTDSELRLREAVLEWLEIVLQEGLEAHVDEAASDDNIFQCAGWIPGDVPLGEWIAERIGGEVEVWENGTLHLQGTSPGQVDDQENDGVSKEMEPFRNAVQRARQARPDAFEQPMSFTDLQRICKEHGIKFDVGQLARLGRKLGLKSPGHVIRVHCSDLVNLEAVGFANDKPGTNNADRSPGLQLNPRASTGNEDAISRMVHPMRTALQKAKQFRPEAFEQQMRFSDLIKICKEIPGVNFNTAQCSNIAEKLGIDGPAELIRIHCSDLVNLGQRHPNHAPPPNSRNEEKKRKQEDMQPPKEASHSDGAPPTEPGKFSFPENKLRSALYKWIRKMRKENPHEPLTLAVALEEKSPGDVGYAAPFVLDKAGLTLEEWVMDKMSEEIELGLDEHDQVVICSTPGDDIEDQEDEGEHGNGGPPGKRRGNRGRKGRGQKTN